MDALSLRNLVGMVGAHYKRVSKLRKGRGCGGGWHGMRRVRAKARASVGVMVIKASHNNMGLGRAVGDGVKGKGCGRRIAEKGVGKRGW